MLPRGWWIGALAAALAAGSCLFSTTPPRRAPQDGGGNGSSNNAVVTGLVQLRDRADGHIRAAPGRAVRGTWYGLDPLGQELLLGVEVVHANQSGVYELASSDRRVRSIEVQSLICNYDPDALECCIQIPPCQRGCNVWAAPRRLSMALGSRAQQDLVVWCDQVP